MALGTQILLLEDYVGPWFADFALLFCLKNFFFFGTLVVSDIVDWSSFIVDVSAFSKFVVKSLTPSLGN